LATAPIALLTDFGLADPYVAALKGVLATRAPGAPIFDLVHEVAPGDVEGAAFLLAAAASYWPAGTVFVAVVDPGVGSERRILAVRHRDRSYLAPDNGLLEPWLDDGEVRAAQRPDLYLQGPGSTFHGRDRFAPLAAFLATGGGFEELGPPVANPERLPIVRPRRHADGGASGRVAHVDRFGNLITDLPSDWLPAAGFELWIGDHRVRRGATHYAAIPRGEPAVVAGSMGRLEVSLRDQSLARAWGVQRGTPVRLVAL
jgi:S-adenosylmethionine hydrolase